MLSYTHNSWIIITIIFIKVIVFLTYKHAIGRKVDIFTIDFL